MSHWALVADEVLARVFRRVTGMPEDADIRSAYPFGERRYHPYKVWLRRVRAWKAARSSGQFAPITQHGPRPMVTTDALQCPLFSRMSRGEGTSP